MASLSTPCHQLSNWSTTRVNSKGPGDSDRGRRWWRSTLTLAKAASRWSFQAPAHCIEVQLQCQRQLLSGLWGTWLEIWCRLLGTSCPIQIIDGLHFFIDVVNCWQCPCQNTTMGPWHHNDIVNDIVNRIWKFSQTDSVKLVNDIDNVIVIWGVAWSTGASCLRNLWHARCDNKACQFNCVLSDSDRNFSFLIILLIF